MLTQEANQRLTQTGPGTPMGNLLRRYWHPISTVTELDASRCMAVRLLGENLALYRNDTGDWAWWRNAARIGRLAGLRHPRGRRPALPLSWLAVQPRRALPGAAGRAGQPAPFTTAFASRPIRSRRWAD